MLLMLLVSKFHWLVLVKLACLALGWIIKYIVGIALVSLNCKTVVLADEFKIYIYIYIYLLVYLFFLLAFLSKSLSYNFHFLVGKIVNLATVFVCVCVHCYIFGYLTIWWWLTLLFFPFTKNIAKPPYCWY